MFNKKLYMLMILLRFFNTYNHMLIVKNHLRYFYYYMFHKNQLNL